MGKELMVGRRRPAAAGALLLAMLAGGPAMAEDASGVWLRDNGLSRVRIAPCGGALCGTIVWLKEHDGPAKVGERVFYDMKPSGESQWRGTAFNPEDGKTYTGKMVVAGGRLTTSGCVLGGLICKSVSWTRYK